MTDRPNLGTTNVVVEGTVEGGPRSRLVAPRPLLPGIYLAPACVVYGIFLLWPLIDELWLSLQRWDGYGAQTFVGLANFVTVWKDPLFRISFEHSAIWEAAAALGPTVVALGLAILIHRSKIRGFSLAALFFPVLLPATAIAAIFVLLLSPISSPLAYLGSQLGLARLGADWLGDPHFVLPSLFIAWFWSSVGAGVLIFSVGLSSIGREYLEVARLEGAGRFQLFWHVTLPALKRLGAVVVLVNIALAAQAFDLIFVTKGGGPGYATMLLPLETYGRGFGGRAGQGAAAGSTQLAIGLLLVLVVLLVVRRGQTFHLEHKDNLGETKRSSWPSNAVLLLCLGLFLLPLASLALTAISPGESFGLVTGHSWFDPSVWTLNNFPSVWQGGMAQAILTSFVLALTAVASVLVLAVPAAFALTHLVKSREIKSIAAGVLIVGLLEPTMALIIPIFSLLRDLHLIGTAVGVILPEIARSIPFAVLVLWAYMEQSDSEVLDAAAVDGASSMHQMIRIAVPVVRPALYAVAVWSFMTSWNEYVLPTIVSQDGSLQTVPSVLATFVGVYDTQYGLLAAGCLIAITPSLIVYLVLRQRASKGMGRIANSLG